MFAPECKGIIPHVVGYVYRKEVMGQNGRMDEFTNERMGEWTDERMGEWMDGRMGGWANGRIGKSANGCGLWLGPQNAALYETDQ